jgi:hypothetical protein
LLFKPFDIYKAAYGHGPRERDSIMKDTKVKSETRTYDTAVWACYAWIIRGFLQEFQK